MNCSDEVLYEWHTFVNISLDIGLSLVRVII